tara:strand:- start:746 stop:1588 length:843 start_codon:yes stop_codon:yes gene_type:complete
MDEHHIYSGKVRDIYDKQDGTLLMKATDRVSSFDKHIGIIPGKGELLNKMSAFWFDNTKHIIKNHLISSKNNESIVEKCKPIPLEIVVRAYITGSTNTSLWMNYKKGVREYCGISIRDGLKKNEKLDYTIITPTTKDVEDKPISKKEIIESNIITEEECDFIYKKALELFKYGEEIADKAGFILVDTKYEFGKNSKGEIMLIDEIHTCDSSRFWIKETYKYRLDKGYEPEKLDKDCVRDWVKSVCNPYTDAIPNIPQKIIDRAYNSYNYFYETISSVDMD